MTLRSDLARFARMLDGSHGPTETPAEYRDPTDWFASSRARAEGDLLLDGADDIDGKGRYSVAAFDPLFILRVRNDRAVLKYDGDETTFNVRPSEAIALLEEVFPRRVGTVTDAFNGGMVYLLSYEMNRYYEPRPTFSAQGTSCDDLWCAFYPKVRLFDAVERRAVDIVHLETDGPPVHGHSEDDGFRFGEPACDESKESYLGKIRRVKRYIEEGDVYQVNLSRRLSASFEGSAWGLYRTVREHNPASYGAFLDGGDFSLLSLSPEMFFTVRGDAVETRPIKGTAPRAADPDADRRSSEWLVSSEKDKAENVMIVDLMRNDLSRICRPHSVTVPALFACETLPTVHHLVSTVRGELKRGIGLPELLSACFPGGSVTGAPKIRAMEIIAERETTPRGFYCGSLVARGLNGAVTASLLIRTLVVADGAAVYRTGGGITIGSDPEREFQETVHKSAMLSTACRAGLLNV